AEGTGALDAYTFIPGDEVGDYQVQVATHGGILTRTLELQPIVEPVVYRSERVGGYVLAGFDPFEKVRILVYELVEHGEVEFSRSFDFNYQNEGFFDLDEYGIGLLEGIAPDQAIAVFRGDPTQEIFEVVSGFDYRIDFIDWEIV